eukprot:3540072-Pyramimonas_sp.AAC.1
MERFKKGLQRLSGVTNLTRTTEKSRRLVSTGARPQLCWGQQGQGIAPTVLKQVRGRLVRGLGCVPKVWMHDRRICLVSTGAAAGGSCALPPDASGHALVRHGQP